MADYQNALIIRFGPFEADIAAGQLRKHGLRIKLQDQPFTILTIFLEHPGEVVTREQLRQRLWAEGTFVDFDNSLNAAINKLREALGDSADSPRYVETLPRRGYRFIAPVARGPVQPAAAAENQTPATVANPIEVTPAAIPPSVLAPVAAPPGRPATRPWFGPAVLALTLTVFGAAYVGLRTLGPRASAASGKAMLAVLPFQNISGDAAQDYLSDGLTEELIAQLSRIQPERLGIIARSTAMQYRRSPKSIEEIARELGIQYAVEGSIRRDGNRIRITAQLVDAHDQAQIWAATFERDSKDVLAIQQEVAGHVARTLALRLKPGSPKVSSHSSTASPEAYEAYTQARFFWGKRSPESVQKSIQLYEKAIKADPNYALAYAGLADSYYVWGGRLSGLPPAEAYARASVAVKKALELDDSLAEAHIAHSAILFDHEWRFTDSEKELLRGLELNPSYAMGHQWHAEFLAAMGRTEEALLAIDRALALEPFSLSSNLVRGQILMYLRRYDEAADQFKKLADIDSTFLSAYASLARVYRAQGRDAEWFAAYYKWLSLLGEKQDSLDQYSQAYQKGGMRAVLQRRLTFLEPLAGKVYGVNYAMARIYAVLGNSDQALAWLARAAQERDDFSTHITVDPELDPLRNDSRYVQLLKKIGFPQVKTS